MDRQDSVFAPGARLLVRDSEWLVRKVDRTSTSGQAVNVIGISELVKNKEAVFLTEVEKNIRVLDPVETKLVKDTSNSFQASLLYIESLLRQTPPTDENLYIGHMAAMDNVPYQLDPTIQSLKQPRQRILIADAVGLGKTLEAGILMSELIRRGKGKRILVLAVKSMLTQFQKELWNRFTIPLTRLDSIGIQRIRSRIPTNHNPFYYYDKAIISIDTLKQDAEYRTYLENAYWDIIVIDEAQNVAQRGKGSSMRARLAKLLSSRSDTLIMLSATPHDGKAKSFASLMNMLNPTAIANPDDYGPEDVKGLFIRRFKKDIIGQAEKSFKERKISVVYCTATPEEEDVYDTFSDLTFSRIDQRGGAGQLFKTTLEKALFSSPDACFETIRNRINRLLKKEDELFKKDIHKLRKLSSKVEKIIPQKFSKYQRLLNILKNTEHGFGWTGKDKNDRLVIFTERIKTLNFLKDNLLKDLGLKEENIDILHGEMSDVNQERVVEDFGKEESPVRLLIASDVASEGINLHYLSHKMIHFDIPWSLMVFQQRNGRIDRYGQERTPLINYFITKSNNEKIRGDMRILELLTEKDEQAEKNIGDPSFFMGVYDIEEEERITATAIEQGLSAEEFEKDLDKELFDPLALLLGTDALPIGQESEAKTKAMPSLFEDDYAYFRASIDFLRQDESIQVDFYPDEKRVYLTAPEDLRYRFQYLPNEIWPENGNFILSANPDDIKKEIKNCIKYEKAWPQMHYLWPLNPVVEWINDKVVAAFGRHEAPVLTLQNVFEANEIVFVMSGLIPNRKAHPLVQNWFGVVFINGNFQRVETFEELLSRTGLKEKSFPNTGANIDIKTLEELLLEAVKQARLWMSEKREMFEDMINEKLNYQLTALKELRNKKYVQLDLRFAESKQSEKIVVARKEKEKREIDKVFDEYLEWVEDTMTTEDNPFIQVVALLKGID